MNETEKRAFEILGEETKEKIAGGVKEDEALTDKQCEKLRSAINELSEEDQLKIAGGCKRKPDAKKIEPSNAEDWENLCIYVAYGGPRPVPGSIRRVPPLEPNKE